MIPGQKPREIAARVLARRRAGKEFTETLLERALTEAAGPTSEGREPRPGLLDLDRRLCQELVYGVVRWQATLDWLIALKTQGRPQKPGLQDLLRLGLYQIFWLDRIPDHAAVHETVAMAKRAGFGPQAGFVNAVLRGFLREAVATKIRLADLKTAQPALGWSQPDWLVARWSKHWGNERTRALLEWNNLPAKLYARVNTLRTEAGKLLAQWRGEGVDYDFLTRDWTGESMVFELKSHPPLTTLESFRQGGFYIQDPSTLLAVRELDPRPGETVLDLCAAPGGKTTFIAQLMDNEGHIVAGDVAEERLKLVRENCTRLGVTCVEAVTARAQIVETGARKVVTSETTLASRQATPSGSPPPQRFDKILVDAPCSNTGVLRRRVDLRWRIQLEEIPRLQSTQLSLLRRAAGLLKPGGLLVYSTCSLEPEENSEVISQFLSEDSGFKLARDRALLPFTDGVDGAFVARLYKLA